LSRIPTIEKMNEELQEKEIVEVERIEIFLR
jgi:hypothetical protein